MKTNLLSIAILSISIFLFSCDVLDNDVVPSSKTTTMPATFSDYDAIEASNAFTVYVSFSDTEESIEIEANENLHQHIVVRKEQSTLRIDIENNVHIRGNATLNAYITTKHVSGYMASGATRFIIDDEINDENINIYLSGASTLTGQLTANNLYTDISGASNLSITGFAENFDLDASGASVMRDYGFETNSLKADLSGASSAHLTIEHEINIEASGASNLKYKGDAVIVKQNLSGASSIKRMD